MSLMAGGSGSLCARRLLRGSATFDQKTIDTRYLFTALCTLVDPFNPEDVKQIHALQDAVKVSQKNSRKFEIRNWDQASQKKERDALLARGETLPDIKRAFGSRAHVDPTRRNLE